MFMLFSFAIIAVILALAIALSEINPFARKHPTMLEQLAARNDHEVAMDYLLRQREQIAERGRELVGR